MYVFMKTIFCDIGFRKANVVNSQSRRKRGRAENMWRRERRADIKMTEYTWRLIKISIKDRRLWRTEVNGLCPKRDDGQVNTVS